jgi:peroxiredoxin
MDSKFKRIISVLCVLVISGLALADAAEKKACPSDCQKACCITQTAPDFTLKDINAKAVQLSKLKGTTVVLEWTSYDCPFVKAHYDTESKTMSKLAAKYADQGVVWLTINSTHYATAETNKAWAEKHELKQAVLVDSDGKVAKLYKARTTPHVFVIDKEGKIGVELDLEFGRTCSDRQCRIR